MTVRQRGLTLILGGVRAGKTAFAERLAARHNGVCYVATAEAHDEEMRARIAAHQRQRPAHWRTLEAPLDPTGALRATPPADAVLLDCLTLWTSNLLLATLDPEQITPADASRAEGRATAAIVGLLDWQRETGLPLYIVSNEVGLGVTPPFPLGRAFQDTLGRLNQRVATAAETVYLVVAGLALDVRRAGGIPIDAPPGLPLD